MNNNLKEIILKGTISIITAIIGLFAGIKIEGQIVQNQMNQTFGNMVNISGSNNNVSIIDVEKFVDDYYTLKEENESLNEGNESLNEGNESLKEENESLKEENESLNKQNESLNEENESLKEENESLKEENESLKEENTKYSEELTESNNSLPLDGESTITEEANLTDQNVLDKSAYVSTSYTGKDSYGNIRTNAILNRLSTGHIIYTLDKEYTYLRCNISMSEGYSIDSTTTISILADDVVVYEAEINKQTEPYDVEITINKCKKITIQFSSYSSSRGCIISNAVLHN